MTIKVLVALLLGGILTASNKASAAQTFHSWNFAESGDDQGFVYQDDLFRDTHQPNYATGAYDGAALRVTVGGVNNANIHNMSGGWIKEFVLPATGVSGDVQMAVDYSVDFSSFYEMDETVEVLCSLVDTDTGSFVVEDLVIDMYTLDQYSSEDRTAMVPLGTLPPGNYKLLIGAFNNKKTTRREAADLFFYNIRLEEEVPVPPVSLPMTWEFASDEQGFVFEDDLFRGTSQPNYANGGFADGALTVTVGGVDEASISNMSGGWVKEFELGETGNVQMLVDYSVDFAPFYEIDEYAEVLCSLVDMNDGSFILEDFVIDMYTLDQYSSEDKSALVPFGTLSPGRYKLLIGAFNSKKTTGREFADLFFYSVRLEAEGFSCNGDENLGIIGPAGVYSFDCLGSEVYGGYTDTEMALWNETGALLQENDDSDLGAIYDDPDLQTISAFSRNMSAGNYVIGIANFPTWFISNFSAVQNRYGGLDDDGLDDRGSFVLRVNGVQVGGAVNKVAEEDINDEIARFCFGISP